MVLFSPDFNCKVDPFNLYIIGNYVKKTIGRYILTVLFLPFYNLITDRGHLPTKIKSIEFPLLSLFIWNRKNLLRSQ